MRANAMKRILKGCAASMTALMMSLTLAVSSYAADVKIISATTDSSNVYLYVSGATEITEGEFKIGNTTVSDVAKGALTALNPPIQTVILLDNSQSIPNKKHEDIQNILEGIINGRLEGETFRFGTFSDSITWVNDEFTNDYELLLDSVKNVTYVDQDTYFSDCLYSVITDLSKANYSTYTRVIMISDGADNQAIGYTNSEVLSLLEKSNIPVYTIGTPGDNDALETMFSFSRASKADYYLLDSNITDDDVINGLLADQNITCFKLTPSSDLLDGSTKSIQASIESAEGSNTLTASVIMPFGDGSSETTKTENASESEGADSTATDSVSGSSDESASSVPSLPSLGGDSSNTELTTSSSVESEKNGFAGWLKNHLIIVIILGIVTVLVVAAAVVLTILTNKKKKEEEARAYKERIEAQKAKAEPVIPKVLPPYIEVRDVDHPENVFKAHIDSIIKIGRVYGDVIIPYDVHVSGSHCEIVKRGELLYVKDCNSQNGTYYNGVRVYDQETPIISGGIIVLGQLKLSITLINN